MRWKTASASVTGKSHRDRGESGQDFCRAGSVQFSDDDYFIGVVADGAGSTANGGRGAEIACTILYDRIISAIRASLDLNRLTDDDIRAWVSAARDAVVFEAGQHNTKPREYASTVIGAVAGGGSALFFQIGDGAIVTGPGPEYRTVFWPEQGEYANTTFFFTDEKYLDSLKIARGEEPDGIAIFTDGLQGLVLSFSEKKAHAGFFSPLFTALRNNPDNGIGGLSRQLGPFLSRDDISARSDDDKTLVIAARVKG